jgi:type IV secretion system protein VirB1
VVATLASVALETLIRSCAPQVGPRTMAAIVAVESGGHPYAIADDDAHRSYYPQTLAGAVALADRLRLLGHSFDAGVAQINSANFRAYGLTTSSVFEPCTNLRAGGAILTAAYRRVQAGARFEPDAQRKALFDAFSIYNSGSPTAAPGYARRVFAAAGQALPAIPQSAAGTQAAALEPARWNGKRRAAPQPAAFSTSEEGRPHEPGLSIAPLDLAALARRAHVL